MVAFDKIADLYDAAYFDKDYISEVDDLKRTIIDGHSVVDIGCGTGKHARLLKKTNPVMGIEPSEAMAIKCSRYFPVFLGAIQNIDPDVVCDAAQKSVIQKTGDKFDVAIAMFDVLDYIVDDAQYHQAMMNINRLVNMHGYFFYEAWNMDEMPKVYEQEVRTKEFEFQRQSWVRSSQTTLKDGIYTINYSYKGGSQVITESHKLKPRLGNVTSLQKYGFATIDKVVDEYSVKMWFVKVREK